jgi:hypothetical protein
MTLGRLRTRLGDGLVLACNDSAAQILGLAGTAELCGRIFPRDHYVNPDDRLCMLEARGRTARCATVRPNSGAPMAR